MVALYFPALLTAFVITLIEMTEVVALVFAFRGDEGSVRNGAYGAVGGVAVVAVIALGFSAALLMFPTEILLWASAVVLAGFGVFLLRSTLRTYRRTRAARSDPPSAPPRSAKPIQFAGGFTVGVVESIETVVVLIALAAAGYGLSALIGAVLAGAVLVGVAIPLHEQVRKIKVPWLKWFGTALVFSYAVFWGGEAAGVTWPGGDLFLLVLVPLALLLVRAGISFDLRRTLPVETKS